MSYLPSPMFKPSSCLEFSAEQRSMIASLAANGCPPIDRARIPVVMSVAVRSDGTSGTPSYTELVSGFNGHVIVRPEGAIDECVLVSGHFRLTLIDDLPYKEDNSEDNNCNLPPAMMFTVDGVTTTLGDVMLGLITSANPVLTSSSLEVFWGKKALEKALRLFDNAEDVRRCLGAGVAQKKKAVAISEERRWLLDCARKGRFARLEQGGSKSYLDISVYQDSAFYGDGSEEAFAVYLQARAMKFKATAHFIILADFDGPSSMTDPFKETLRRFAEKHGSTHETYSNMDEKAHNIQTLTIDEFANMNEKAHNIQTLTIDEFATVLRPEFDRKINEYYAERERQESGESNYEMDHDEDDDNEDEAWETKPEFLHYVLVIPDLSQLKDCPSAIALLQTVLSNAECKDVVVRCGEADVDWVYSTFMEEHEGYYQPLQLCKAQVNGDEVLFPTPVEDDEDAPAARLILPRGECFKLLDSTPWIKSSGAFRRGLAQAKRLWDAIERKKEGAAVFGTDGIVEGAASNESGQSEFNQIATSTAFYEWAKTMLGRHRRDALRSVEAAALPVCIDIAKDTPGEDNLLAFYKAALAAGDKPAMGYYPPEVVPGGAVFVQAGTSILMDTSLSVGPVWRDVQKVLRTARFILSVIESTGACTPTLTEITAAVAKLDYRSTYPGLLSNVLSPEYAEAVFNGPGGRTDRE